MKLRSRRVWIGAGVGVVVVAAVALVAPSSLPSVGKITEVHVSAAAQPAPDRHLNGRYFALTYPAAFSSSTEVGDATALEQYRFIGASPSAASLAVTIHPLPDGQLMNDSSYHLRSIEPDQYHETIVTVAAGQAHIMSRVDGSESTAFLAHDDKLATIAVTAAQSSPNLQAQAIALAATFRWRG
jgi:hypothetical protein